MQNRLPTKALKDTPFEAWYGVKPSLCFLKVFDCFYFLMFLRLNVTNLTRRQSAIIGIHVAYSEVSKAYKVYHPQTKKMTITRDVHFSENE